MVLDAAAGGAAPARAPRGPQAAGEEGSQSLELALLLPAVVLLLTLLVHAALLGADLVAAQGVAREAARVAAVADDAAVRKASATAAGNRPVEVTLQPPAGARVPGRQVTAAVRLRSRAFEAFGLRVWLPAEATMRVEER